MRNLVCSVYHADFSKEKRKAIYREWKKGTIRVLIATSALGLGIDYGQVRFVFHQGQSRSLMDFSQESGRAGRDGKEAHSVIFTSKEMREKCEWIEEKETEWTGHLTGGFKAMKDWVAGRKVDGVKECRRIGLGLYMDGKGTNCLSLGECVWCDICSELMTMSESDGSDESNELAESDELSEMNVDSYTEGWDEDMMDLLNENMITADQTQRQQVSEAMEIKEMMDVFRKRCVVCWMNDISAGHAIENCQEMWGNCTRCLSKDHAVRGCARRKYTGGYCCFKCGMPQKLKKVHIHGIIATGTCEDGYMDKLPPLCWYLWRKSKWRVQLETHFQREWSEPEFEEWICRIENEMTNGTRVMLWMWNLKENH